MGEIADIFKTITYLPAVFLGFVVTYKILELIQAPTLLWVAFVVEVVLFVSGSIGAALIEFVEER